MSSNLLGQLTALCISALGVPPSFDGVGDLPGGAFFSRATSISADGTTVVGESSSDSGRRPFRWTRPAGMTLANATLSSLGGSPLVTVSADGSVLAGSRTGVQGGVAWRWTQAGGSVDIPLGGFFRTDATAIAWDGATIVGGNDGQLANQRAWRWTPGTGTLALPMLPGAVLPFDRALAVSADGSIVVGSAARTAGIGFPDAGEEAFRWSAATGTVGLGAGTRAATAVSADGAVIVGTSVFGAFRWQSGILTALGGNAAGPTGMSADGSIVVGMDDAQSPFLWSAAFGTRPLLTVLLADCGLDLGGWTLTSVSAVSADGLTISGSGVNPQGFNEGWVATIPAPSGTTSVLVFGVLIAARRRRVSSRTSASRRSS